MDLLPHTTAWVKGEMLEMALVGVAGLVVLALTFILWKYGNTAAAKALVVPFAVVGILFSSMGAVGYASNHARLTEFAHAHAASPDRFATAEKARVEGFQSLYLITLVMAPVFFALACGAFWFTTSPSVRATALAIAVLGVAGLLIDYFSKARADRYYDAIQMYLSIPAKAAS